MTQSNVPSIEQMDEVIGMFHDWQVIKGEHANLYKKDGKVYCLGDFKCHTSWDWLMPVVEKIEPHAHVTVRVGICTIWRKFMAAKIYAKENNIPFEDVMPIAECNDKGFIGNVYHAVYQFITWYNQQTTTNEQ